MYKVNDVEHWPFPPTPTTTKAAAPLKSAASTAATAKHKRRNYKFATLTPTPPSFPQLKQAKRAAQEPVQTFNQPSLIAKPSVVAGKEHQWHIDLLPTCATNLN